MDNFIEASVVIEEGAILHPFCILRGQTIVRKGAEIFSFCEICDSEIDEGATVKSSTLDRAYVGKNSKVGPDAFLRPNAIIGQNCRIGNFVEIKNSVIGDGTKIAHLAYVGDAEVGKKCNIGCGVIFVNYDGKQKHKTKVGDNCFIGSNCNLIAPLTIGDGVFVAAGTTVTENLEKEDFCIGRARQIVKKEGAKKYK